jgi:hypothetical protein
MVNLLKRARIRQQVEKAEDTLENFHVGHEEAGVVPTRGTPPDRNEKVFKVFQCPVVAILREATEERRRIMVRVENQF